MERGAEQIQAGRPAFRTQHFGRHRHNHADGQAHHEADDEKQGHRRSQGQDEQAAAQAMVPVRSNPVRRPKRRATRPPACTEATLSHVMAATWEPAPPAVQPASIRVMGTNEGDGEGAVEDAPDRPGEAGEARFPSRDAPAAGRHNASRTAIIRVRAVGDSHQQQSRPCEHCRGKQGCAPPQAFGRPTQADLCEPDSDGEGVHENRHRQENLASGEPVGDHLGHEQGGHVRQPRHDNTLVTEPAA
jgi:hypothetical protein